MTKPGLALERMIVVDENRTISFMGPQLRVYATPRILEDIEYACRDLLLPELNEGEDSVGSQVALSHVGAALLKQNALVSVSISDVEGQRVTFAAIVKCGDRVIAEASHIRTIVSVEKLRKRLEALQ